MAKTLPQDLSVDSRELLERNYWRNSPTERPGAESIENLLNKFGDARRFWMSVERHRAAFGSAAGGRILELGGGQGWAACILKRVFPAAEVMLSDLSEDAIASLPTWERVFSTQLDRAFACRSSEVPLADSSLDLAFCFAAAHHFPNPAATLKEMHRILRPGGTCIYLYEPSCSSLLYPLALRRVNSIRLDIPEDVIVPSRLCRLAGHAGFKASAVADVEALDRGGLKATYYMILRALPILQGLLPVTRDFTFVKL